MRLVKNLVNLALNCLVCIFRIQLLKLAVTFLFPKCFRLFGCEKHAVVIFDGVDLINQVLQVIGLLQVVSIELVQLLSDLLNRLLFFEHTKAQVVTSRFVVVGQLEDLSLGCL